MKGKKRDGEGKKERKKRGIEVRDSRKSRF
jgi:hypothetical protein